MKNNPGIATSCRERKAQLVQIGEPPLPVYWKSMDELRHGPRFTGEFPGGLPSAGGNAHREATRRDFLAVMGFTLAAAGLAGCRGPVQNAIPLLVGADDIIPGVANYYATTCRGCASSCSLLVKQRDGRPIKVEGNAESTLFGNGTCATGQATVLSLYDDARFRGPLWHGQPASWNQIDQRVLESLRDADSGKNKIVLLSSTVTSPSTLKVIAEFGQQHANFSHVMYDAISYSAVRSANAQLFERAVIPHYSFDKARMIVGLEADFLGTWLSPVEFARQYAAGRKPEGVPSLHVQFESGLSVTGSNADARIPITPSQVGAIAVALLRRIAQKAGVTGAPEPPESAFDSHRLDAIADELWKHREESLLVSGVNDFSVQTVVGALNWFLGNIGRTIDLAHPSFQRTGDDSALANLVEATNRGEVHTLILYGVNPAYDYSDAEHFVRGLEKVAFSVSCADRPDETSSHVHAVCPDHHFLEAWGDAEPVAGHFSLAQPLIAPLFGTRAVQETLLRWSGNHQPDYYNYLRDYWRETLFPRQKELHSFDLFWDRTLQDGVATLPPTTVVPSPSLHGDWTTAAHTILQAAPPAARNDDRYELHLYESVGLRDGRHANNPWLQELPDPISKLTWGNCAAVAASLAQQLGLTEGDVVRLKTDRGQRELPVFIQPGQHPGTISVAVGYGRTLAGKVGDHIGVNVFPLTSLSAGARRLSILDVVLEKTGRRDPLAGTQSHFSMEGRPIVLETTLVELQQGKDADSSEEPLPTLWAERLHGEHAWGMALDMNACTGCSACVVACQAENNVPVVGKDQVQRQRIMHWIRIDRYYRGSEENPVSVHQPMMCQHCQNAPCETVCPVLATTTSSEGLNQQVYNRCIGTRYCANNCPYKVRRFNWYNYTENQAFDFNMNSPLERMVLNPDVVVRSRGVMEKCSMCVQRIQLAKNIALQGKREIVEGDIQTACQQACPTQAIVFGDLKDPNSRVSKLRQTLRHYEVLEELGVRPNVGYLKKVRNPISNL